MNKKNISYASFLITYLIINLLFLYKYSLRQNYINEFVLMFSFIILTLTILNLKSSYSKLLNLKSIYITICSISFVFIVFITFVTDGNALNVDRWSAMDVAIRAFLEGKYPYTATDHLNGRTSNFPGLIILGIPFYFLGNVGYIQPFAFALLSYTIYKSLKIKEAILFILLLIISPAYWWEIFSISDLLSNIIIVFCFIILIYINLKNDIYKYPIILGIIIPFLVLTRGIVSIPLVLFFFKDFWKIRLKNQLLFTSSFILSFASLTYLVIMNCPDIETLKKYNPLSLQTSYLPSYVNIISLALPFFFSFKIIDFNKSFFKYAAILILIPTTYSFLIFLNEYGLKNIILKSKFDLSYLTVIFPFIIIEIIKSKHKNV